MDADVVERNENSQRAHAEQLEGAGALQLHVHGTCVGVVTIDRLAVAFSRARARARGSGPAAPDPDRVHVLGHEAHPVVRLGHCEHLPERLTGRAPMCTQTRMSTTTMSTTTTNRRY